MAGKIFAVATGDEITESPLMSKLSTARYVLIGEKHDNPDHHIIEDRILTRLVEKNTRVVFEMLDDSQQPLLSHLSKDDSLETLKQKLDWPQKGWQWDFYGPLIQRTLQADGVVVAGNVAVKKIKQIYASDPALLNKEKRFQTMGVLSASDRKAVQQQVFESHCELMPMETLLPMVNIQLAKDASMAYALTQGEARQSILVTGGFHADKTLGVPRHLQQLAPAETPVVVMLYEVEEGLETLDDYLEDAGGADFVWFTPKATDKDYCQGLRKHFQTKNSEV